MIPDTSYLIDLFDGRREAFERGPEPSESRTVHRVPSPVITGIFYGTGFGDEDE